MAGISLSPSQCCCGGFSQQFTVRGCVNPAKNPAFFTGLTVEVWTSSGGTLIVSGTTNSLGVVTLSIPGSIGTYWVTSSTPWSGRNDAFAQNVSLTGVALTLALVPHTGYVCCAQVDWALPSTLHWSDGDSSVSLIWDAVGQAQWTVLYNMAGTRTPTFSCSPLNCNGAAGTPIIRATVTCGLNNTFGVARQWWEACVTRAYDRGPLVTCVGLTVCGATASYSGTGGPPFSFSGALSFTAGGSCTKANPVTGTVTITE